MTPETKKKALAKLAAFDTDKVGYPEKWKDYSSVEVRRDDYLGNSRRAQVFEIRRAQARIDKPTDRTLWGMTPPTVNAYYNSANNEIVFPAGILQPPFFDRGDRRPGELRRHRRRDRPRVHARLRRPGQQVRRPGQPRELVDGRRPEGVPGAHRVHREAVRGLRAGEGRRERRRAPQRQADARREHGRQRRPARRLRGAAEDARRQAARRRSTASRRSSASSSASPTSGARTSRSRRRGSWRRPTRTRRASSGSTAASATCRSSRRRSAARPGQPMVRENACRAW